MKNLVKNLPSKKDLKDFYNFNPNKNFKVKKIQYCKQCILLDCEVKDIKKTFTGSFYMDIHFINFEKNTFSIEIKNRFFPHVINNVNINLDYIKSL